MTVKVNLFLGKKYFKIENLKNKERKFSSYLLKIYKNKVVINPSAVEKNNVINDLRRNIIFMSSIREAQIFKNLF